MQKQVQKELNQAKSEEFLANETIKDSSNFAFRGYQFRACIKKNCVYRGI
jgi:hypothetical protein